MLKINDPENRFNHSRIKAEWMGLKAYLEFIGEPSVIYDLGASVGTFTIPAMKQGHYVVAYEPEELNFNSLKENILYYQQNNEEGRIEVYQVAISNRSNRCMAVIKNNKAGHHHKSLITDTFCNSKHIQKGAEIIKVNSMRLQTHMRKFHPPKPKHIKIDIDGSEYDFIMSCKDRFLKSLGTMFIEIDESNKFAKEVVQYLYDSGFKLHHKFPVQKGTPQLLNYLLTR